MKKARVLGIVVLLLVMLAAGLLVPGYIALKQEENCLTTIWKYTNKTIKPSNLSK